MKALDQARRHHEQGDEGYVLLAVLVLVFLMLLTLTIAAPRIAMQLKREREVETKHRADQYVRAIRVFYRKTGHYPTSVEQLLNTNNQKFLRQKYLDPMTGKDDWRLIHVGENKTTVKGFFGQDLPGIGGPGLGSGIGSGGTTGSTPGSTAGSTFGGSLFGSGNGSNGGQGGGSGSSFGAGSSFGSAPGGAATGPGSNSVSGTTSNGTGSQDATTFGGGGGPIMGIGVPSTGEAFLTVNGVSTYEEWEFLYDPRIEQLYAKGATLGGGISGGSGTSGSGFGSGNGPGATPGIGGSGAGGAGGNQPGNNGPGSPQAPQQ
jgi:type II secretory pathway pseudopilin PulG